MATPYNKSLPEWAAPALATAIGLFAGSVAFHNNELQSTVLVLLVLGGMLGLTRPRHAWRCATMAALGTPAGYLIGWALAFKPAGWPQPNFFATLIAVIPAFIGIYSGIGIRKAASLIGKNEVN